MRLLALFLLFPVFSISASTTYYKGGDFFKSGWVKTSEVPCSDSAPHDDIKAAAVRYCNIKPNGQSGGFYISHRVKMWLSDSSSNCGAKIESLCSLTPPEPPPDDPCKTPKTDDQCNKGKTATITGNDVFWATGNYKGCTFTAADGVFIKLADGSMTGDATSTGSTGKSWCETTDSTYNPADDEALSKNPAFSPAKDNDPKNCKNGWVQAGGGKFHCLNDTSGNVDAPPDKVNPEDGSINSDKDGKPKPPDAGVGKPPTGGTDPDGGGGTGPDGGGDCEGEDCEGGGGTKPPARPADPWADILDAADVARVKADTQSVQDELADFYRSAASGFQININKPAAGAMPSYGDITQGGQKISLSMSWLDKISFADGRAGVLVLCSLIAAYIILVRR